MSVQELWVADIRTDGGTQMRAQLDLATCAEYADAMQQGAQFPPVVVFYDGSDYWLADGFQRHDAARSIERETLAADVRAGTRRDAILYAVGANATHGLPRSNADKRRAVETLLRDEEWARRSDNWIAQQCAVSNHMVASLRTDLEISKSNARIGADGRTINTANIGRRAEPEPTPAYEPVATFPVMQVGTPDDAGHRESTPAAVNGCAGCFVVCGAAARQTVASLPAAGAPARCGLTRGPESTAAHPRRGVAVSSLALGAWRCLQLSSGPPVARSSR